MKRAVGVLLALLSLPLMAASQQAPVGSDGTHLVSSGETLGSIAARYYGDASEWVRIFEANRDQLSDPDVLSPGLSLRIPDDGMARAAVVGLEFPGAATPVQDVVAPEGRRNLLEATRFQPQGIPAISSSDRTVFFEFAEPVDESRSGESEPSEAGEADQPPAVPEGRMLAGGWVIPAGTPVGDDGVVMRVLNDGSVAGAEVAARLYGHVRIEARDGVSFQQGDRYQTFTLQPTIQGVGSIAVPSGVVEVTETGGDEATAQVVQLFGRFGIGELLVGIDSSPLPRGVYPTETDLAVAGRLIALQQPAVLYLPRVYAFADLGTEVGIHIGDELVGVADDVPEWSSETLGRFQVVGVRELTSTLLLMSTIDPKAVRPGLRVVLDRSMP